MGTCTPWNVTKDSVWEAFEKCGTVQRVRLAIDKDTGSFKRFGHVSISDTA